MGIEEVMKSVVEKLKEALLTVENWGDEALAWFDRIFPPETRGDKINHWFHVALPYLLAAVILTVMVLLCCCCCACCLGCYRLCCACCRGCYRLCRACCRGCYRLCRACCLGCYRLCCRGGRRVKIMKAPGRNCLMPRPDFETDPRIYFQRLRSHPGDELC